MKRLFSGIFAIILSAFFFIAPLLTVRAEDEPVGQWVLVDTVEYRDEGEYIETGEYDYRSKSFGGFPARQTYNISEAKTVSSEETKYADYSLYTEFDQLSLPSFPADYLNGGMSIMIELNAGCDIYSDDLPYDGDFWSTASICDPSTPVVGFTDADKSGDHVKVSIDPNAPGTVKELSLTLNIPKGGNVGDEFAISYRSTGCENRWIYRWISDEVPPDIAARGVWELVEQYVYVPEPDTYKAIDYIETVNFGGVETEHNFITSYEKIVDSLPDIATATATVMFSSPPPASFTAGEHIKINVSFVEKEGGGAFSAGGVDSTSDDVLHYPYRGTYVSDNYYGIAEFLDFEVRDRGVVNKDNGYLNTAHLIAPIPTDSNKEHFCGIRYYSASWLSNQNMPTMVYTDYIYQWNGDTNAGAVIENGTENGTETVTESENVDVVVTKEASDKKGEDKEKIPPAAVAGIFGIAGAAAVTGAAVKSAKKKKDPKDEKKEPNDDPLKSTYELRISKDFGDTIYVGQKVNVFARLVEITEKGVEKDRTDLTSMVQITSPDFLIVSNTVMYGNYKKADVGAIAGQNDKIPETAMVNFSLAGAGGSFTEKLIFKISAPMILFAQESLGIPANYDDTEYELNFALKGFSNTPNVKIELKKLSSTDGADRTIDAKLDKITALKADLTADKSTPGLYTVKIIECAKNVMESGTIEAYELHILAESGNPGTEGYQKAECSFPVYRVHLGLSLCLGASSIGCYLKFRSTSQGVTEPKAHDFEPVETRAWLMLYEYDKEKQSIIRIPVAPDAPVLDAGGNIISKGVNVYAKRVENDRYAHKLDADKDHQAMVDKLGIVAFPTNSFAPNGARTLRLTCSKGILEPPVRMTADVEITVTWNERKYSARREVLLLSQPFKVCNSTEERVAFDKEQAHIKERLEHIQSYIFNNCPHKLYSLNDMCERMITGYDKRFGYDPRQVMHVMRIYSDFLEGRNVGAGGGNTTTSFADELAACYAFMQGLRDNTGFLGRVAMGVFTGGYSEYVFTTMSLAEEMQYRVYAVKPGEPEFDTWAAIKMGTAEFAKGLLMEAALVGGVALTKCVVLKTTGVDIVKVAESGMKAYRNAMDSLDQTLCANSKLYKTGADALKKTKNFFNSVSGSAAKAIEDSAEANAQASAKAERTIRENRSKLSPAELKAVEEYDLARASGLKKVQKLKDAQQQLARAHGPEKELARQKYQNACAEVWADKNALSQLQASTDPYAKNMRAEFNRFREGVLDRVEQRAMDEISRDHKIPRDELYKSNVTSGDKVKIQSGDKVPGDRDISINRKVVSDRSKDFTIDQRIGEDAVARNLYREMHGYDAPSIEAAREYMRAMDTTYVCPQGNFSDYVIQPNMDAYADVKGMIGFNGTGIDKSLLNSELKATGLNRATVIHKGKEWWDTAAKKSLAAAQALEKEAQTLTGAARAKKLSEAVMLRYKAQGEIVEGIRQITKQVDNCIDPRNTYNIAKGKENLITPRIREIHALAKRVGKEMSPAEFEKVLRESYGISSLDDYAVEMAKCLA